MGMSNGEPAAPDDTRFVRRVLILLGIGVAVVIAFVLRELLILVFGSVVIAVLLTAMTNPIQRWTKLKRGLALTMAILVLLGIVAGAGALFGSQVSSQAQQLSDQVPAAWNDARGRLARWGVQLPELSGGAGGSAQERDASQERPEEGNEETQTGFGELDGGMLGQLGRFVMSAFGALGYTLLVIAGGIYFAAQPKLYRTGIMKLFPQKRRELLGEAYDETGRALKLWLLGTLVSMSLVGLLTGVGLWLIGVPSAVALGLLAGLLEFVPIIGPIAAAIPAVLLAFSQSTEMALWTIGLFVLVQQLEGNVVQPIVQRYAVDLPPALLLFSVVAGGFLFGIVGILFAAPLTVAAFVIIKRLYVREALKTETPLPHET